MAEKKTPKLEDLIVLVSTYQEGCAPNVFLFVEDPKNVTSLKIDLENQTWTDIKSYKKAAHRIGSPCRDELRLTDTRKCITNTGVIMVWDRRDTQDTATAINLSCLILKAAMPEPAKK